MVSILNCMYKDHLMDLPATPNGAPKPRAIVYVSHCVLPLSAGIVPTHKAPVSQSKPLGQRVEWDVASWTLWVVVWGRHLGAGGRETTAGDHRGRGRRGTDSSAGKHLGSRSV